MSGKRPRGFAANAAPSRLLDEPSPQISESPVDDIRNDVLFIEDVDAGGKTRALCDGN